MKQYRIKLTALSPIHIGAGEDYVPTNYVIDSGYLYEFDEQKFYHKLSIVDKKAFVAKMGAGIIGIKSFYQDHKVLAKSLSVSRVKVSNSVEKRYVVKINKNGTVNNNQLEVAKCVKEKNTHKPYIPGSTLKGMLETALEIYPKANKKATNEKRQKLKLSDAFSVESSVEVGFMRRADIERNGIISKNGGVSNIAEVVQNGSIFVLTLESEYSFETIKQRVEDYQEKKENRISSKNNAFIARIGMGSGKAYMLEKDRVAMNNKKPPVPVATHWLFDNDSGKFEAFGWIECELIDKKTYEDSLQKFETSLIEVKAQYNAFEQEREAERQARQDVEKEQKQQAEKERLDKEVKEAKEKEKLASMSPIDKLIYSYEDIPSLINDMKADSIEDFENIKSELAQKIKLELQKDPKLWEKAKQKALKRKEYIESLL